jgi:hypothetical protein
MVKKFYDNDISGQVHKTFWRNLCHCQHIFDSSYAASGINNAEEFL